MQNLLQWLDLAWVVIALIVARKEQRVWVLGFFAGCMIMMRLEVELMQSIGYNQGIIGLLDYGVQARGLAVFSLFYLIFLVWLMFSPYAKGTILMAVSISIFFTAAFISMLAMCL